MSNQHRPPVVGEDRNFKWDLLNARYGDTSTGPPWSVRIATRCSCGLPGTPRASTGPPWSVRIATSMNSSSCGGS